MGFWQNERATVAGRARFPGCHVGMKVEQQGCRHIIVPGSKNVDMVSCEACRRFHSV